MMIKRQYDIDKLLKPNKVLVILGSRQTGKTTLLNQFLNKTKLKYKLDTGDNIKLRALFETLDIDSLQEYTYGYDLLAIDEAQRLPNIGECLKILIDNKAIKYIIVTGSSSFELQGQIGEPLTGRKSTHKLYAIAQSELLNIYNKLELRQKLENFLVFGSYPEIVTAKHRIDKMKTIDEITQSYLFKDIVSFEKIKNSKTLLDLLQLLAYQIGSEVSLHEISQKINLDVRTVTRYLDILEKSFIIYSLRGFSRNLRNEITKKNKYYFYDNGIRNAIIANFNKLEQRNDIGQLWENFIIIERLKYREYNNIIANDYFWRTWQQNEIDLIEEREGKLFAFEFKYNPKKSIKAPKLWTETYTESIFEIINNNNYLDYL